MANKRISLSNNERYIIAKALEAAKEDSSYQESLAADVGRAKIEELIIKVAGSKPSSDK